MRQHPHQRLRKPESECCAGNEDRALRCHESRATPAGTAPLLAFVS